MSYKESNFKDDLSNLKLLHPNFNTPALITLLINMNNEIQDLKKKVSNLEDKK